MKPHLTVIINTVNEVPDRLINTILSFQNQKNVCMQIIISTIVDDVSILIGNEYKCQVVVSPQKGIYEQLNYAIEFIEGEFWCYSSGHDIAHPTKMIEEYTFCKKYNKKVCYSSYNVIYPGDEGSNRIQTFYAYDYEKHVQIGNFVSDCSLMSIDLIRKYGPFRNKEFHNDSHYDLWLRIYEGEGDVFTYHHKATWDYIQYQDSKHILRKKDPEELKEYEMIREHVQNDRQFVNLRIRQCVVSNSISSFEKEIFEKYNFTPYQDVNEPCIFWGCYTTGDIQRVLSHNSLAVIIWAGSDSMNPEIKALKGINNIKNIVSSKWNADDLDKLGIEYKFLPISICNRPEIEPEPLGDKIYIYTSKLNPEFYGKKIYDKLIEHYGPEMFDLCFNDSYTKEELMQVYKNCFMGLRIIDHDGLSETVCELGLMGRYVVHNGNTPNSLPYGSYEDIIIHIENERKKKNYVDIQLHNAMTSFLNVDDKWLHSNFYFDNLDEKLKKEILFKKPKKNKLGVAYSVFDDLDHLRESLVSIRANVDFIVIVYQNVSYTGQNASFSIYKELKILKEEGLIDDVQEFRPDFKLTTKGNEVRKRNLGLYVCQNKHCTHYITMDCDEVFIPKQFKRAKRIIFDYDYKASFIFSQTYYKDKNHVISPPERFHVPFIYKIMNGKFKLDAKIEGIVADKSRKMTNIENDLIIFERSFIQLHHYCYVRRDMKRKLDNKASGITEVRKEKIMDSYNNFKKWKLNQKVFTENGTFNIKFLLVNLLSLKGWIK